MISWTSKGLNALLHRRECRDAFWPVTCVAHAKEYPTLRHEKHKRNYELPSSLIVVVSYFWMFSFWCWYASLTVFWVHGIWGYCLRFVQFLSSSSVVIMKCFLRCICNVLTWIFSFETPHASRRDFWSKSLYARTVRFFTLYPQPVPSAAKLVIRRNKTL